MCWRMGFVHAMMVAAVITPAAVMAQVPPPVTPYPEAAPITACLCLQRSYTALAAEMNAKAAAYQAANREVQDLNAQLAREQASANVNNPDAVERVKALLERRDAASNTLQPAYSAAAEAVARYNAAVSEYNAHCANRPGIPVLTPEVQARLVCPPVR